MRIVELQLDGGASAPVSDVIGPTVVAAGVGLAVTDSGAW
jgi:hypothetical protein